MEKTNCLNILRVIFTAAIAIMSLIVFFNPPKTETNILKAILSNSKTDSLLVSLSQKHSGRLNVIFESDDPQTAAEAKKNFEQKIPKDLFKADFSDTKNFKQILNTYKDNYRNLLSPKTRYELEQGDFEAVKLEGLERVYNPLSVNIIPLEKDPFYFFNDYLQSLYENAPQVIDDSEKYYETLNLNFKDEIVLSPTLLNKEMKKILDIKNTIENKNSNLKISLAGAPIHTYSASSRSMLEINIICILSSIFIILLCKYCFKSFKMLIPISISISLGIFSGYLLTSIIFKTIHMLTFVFSTTLIGICIDYSLHYFAHSCDIRAVFKSLTASMLTTVCAFLILLFSNIELLKQIAVFTAAGLFTVYAFVVLFYPKICKLLGCTDIKTINIEKLFSFKVTKRTKRVVVLVVVFLTAIGLSKLQFNDDIRNMYTPSKDLQKAEKLNNEINGNGQYSVFLITNAGNLQSLLEQEEFLTKKLNQQDYTALSKFLPSISQQKENFKLRKQLYKKELNNYAAFIPQKYRNNLLKENYPQEFLMPESIPEQIKNSFLMNETSSVVLLKHADKKLKHNAEKKGAIIIDLKKDISDRVKTCRRNCLKLLIPVVIFLFGAMSFAFKPKNTVLIILPSLLGGLFTLSLLGLFGVDVNLFHVLSLFLIIGFSLDYSIFRFNDSGTKNYTASRTAVFISCATTVFSFFLLSVTSFKLVSSLGFMISCGLVCSYILSLILIRHKQET